MLGTENAQLCSKTGSKRQGRLETGVKRVVEFKMGAGAFERLETWKRSEMIGDGRRWLVTRQNAWWCLKVSPSAQKQLKMRVNTRKCIRKKRLG